MLEIKQTETATHKTIKYKDLKIGDTFEPIRNNYFKIGYIYIKSSNGRFRITDFEFMRDNTRNNKEMNEFVYLLEAELNVKRISE